MSVTPNCVPGIVSLELQEKLAVLQANLRKLGSLLSPFLARGQRLSGQGGSRCVAGPGACRDGALVDLPGAGIRGCRQPCLQIGVRQVAIVSEELDIDGFAENPGA